MTDGQKWKNWQATKRLAALKAVATANRRERIACLRCGTEVIGNLQLHHRIKFRAPGQDWWSTVKEATATQRDS